MQDCRLSGGVLQIKWWWIAGYVVEDCRFEWLRIAGLYGDEGSVDWIGWRMRQSGVDCVMHVVGLGGVDGRAEW